LTPISKAPSDQSGGKLLSVTRKFRANQFQEKETKYMKNFVENFLQNEQGQDLIEYTLLLAFVALASAAIFIGAGSSIMGIWNTTNASLANANSYAAS
jgi:Flp pilus assembly pilin Flp